MKLEALEFADDLISAMAKGPKALASMTGYRQMAYVSTIDGSVQPYSLYVPATYSPKKNYGLIAALHGYTGNDYEGGAHLAALGLADWLALALLPVLAALIAMVAARFAVLRALARMPSAAR
jgi:hypothetical protein